MAAEAQIGLWADNNRYSPTVVESNYLFILSIQRRGCNHDFLLVAKHVKPRLVMCKKQPIRTRTRRVSVQLCM